MTGTSMTADTRPGPGRLQEAVAAAAAAAATTPVTAATETHPEEGGTDLAPMGVITVGATTPRTGTHKATR